MTPTITALDEGDVEAALAIDLESFPASELGAGDPRAVREAQLREELRRPWARVRAARDRLDLVGYTLVWHVVDELHLLNIAVAGRARRRGVARALMADLVRFAQENAVAKILLEVRVSNAPAIALYEAFGFERLGARSKYYADGEDALEMMRRCG